MILKTFLGKKGTLSFLFKFILIAAFIIVAAIIMAKYGKKIFGMGTSFFG